MRELIIDRFEETYVVCQTPDGKPVEIDEEKTIRRRLANMYRMKNMLKRKY